MLEDKTFLYIEDDYSSRKVMQLMMTRLIKAKELIMFEDGTDFANRFRKLTSQPDIILLDIHLEPINGFEILDLIRLTPGHQNTPVIAVTASVMSEEVEKLRLAGFNGTISKPLSMSSFPSLLQQVAAGEAVWHTA